MSLGSNIDTLEIKNADKIKFIGTSNTVVDTTTGRIGIGTDTPEDALHVNGGIRFGGHIIPLNNAVFDIGSAENKIRDMYVDTNSLWIGDTTKIAFSDGKMKFKRRKVDKVPKMLLTLVTDHDSEKNEGAIEEDAVSFAKTIDPTITTISDLKLQHWRDFTKTFDESKSISDIFVDNDEDYEAITASEAFMEVGSNIFTEHSLSIGKTTDPVSALDVVGDINLTGSLLINGVAQTFSDGGVSSQWSDIDSTTDISYSGGNVGIGITPQAKLHVDGDTIITGNLTVSGTTTTVDTDNLRVRDPIIELGKDNTVSSVVDLGLVMTRPTGNSNVAIIFDESTDTLEIGYTQGSASDSTITIENAVDNPLHVNVNGVLSGDGSGLTALNAGNIASGTIEAARIPDIWSNLASNVTRIVSLETSNADIWSNLASNVTRVVSLETSNTDIWSNLASNVTRVVSLETSNADIWSNLASNVTRIGILETNTEITSEQILSLETSNADIWSNLASNVTRITSLEDSYVEIVDGVVALETSNTDIWSNLASNVTRVVSLETSNADIWSNLASNVTRITSLETSNTDIWSNLASNVTRVVSLETSNADIWSNLASNVTRIVSLETSNTGIWSNLASNVTRIASLETDLASNALKLTTLTLDDVVNISNITSNTIEITNTTTGLVTTANVSVGRDLTVSGNLTVLGTTTTVDTDNLRVGDPIIEIGKDNTAAPIVDLGIVMTRPPGNSNVAIIYDESATKLEIGYTQGSASDSTITMETATANPISLNVNGSIRAGHDQDVTSYLGRAAIGYIPGVPPGEVDTTILNSLTVVATADGNKYSLNGVTQPTLYLQKGVTYTGIQASIQQYADHPLKISATPDGTHGGDNTILAAAYSDMGGAIFIPTSPASPDILYYFCPNHPNMGGMIITGQGSPDTATFAHVDHNTATNFALKQTAAGATHISSTVGQGLSFSIGNIEKARIGSNGDFFVDTDTLYVDTVNDRVGVGTSSPDANLHVEGNVYVSSNLEVGKVGNDVLPTWYQTISGTSTKIVRDMAVDSGGDVYVTGYYNSTSTVSLGNGLNLPVTSGSDGFIVKYNSSGTAQWYQTISGTSSGQANGIAVDSGGNVYVTGYYNSTTAVSLGPSLDLPITTRNDVFIVKYNSSGTAQWYQTIAGTFTDAGYDIAVDSGGNVYVTGFYTSSTTVSLGNGINLPVSAMYDVIIVKYDTYGIAQWYETIPGPDTDIGHSIGVDSGGNVYVSGYYTSGSTVSLGNGLNLPSTVYDTDLFIVKYNSSGTAQWYQTISPMDPYNEAIGMAVDSEGNVYVTGYYQSTTAISLGNNLELPIPSGYDSEVFIVKYDTSGTAQWYQTIPGTAYDVGYGIAVDSSGSVYATGYYNSITPVSLGNGLNLPASTYNDVYIVKYDTSGTAQWYQTISGTGTDVGSAVAVDSGGKVYVTGQYNSTSTASLGNGLELPVSSGNDIFIVKYDSSIPIFFIDATTAMVGIGTSTPGYTLDVAGDINFTGSVNQNGTPFEPSPWTTTGDDISYTTGRVGIGASTPGYTLDVAGDINFTGALTQNGTTYGGGSSPWVTSGSVISYTTGGVGIGTNSPQGTLHVSSGTAGDCNLILQADTDNNNEGDNPRIEFWQDGAIQEAAIGMTSNRLNLWNSVSFGGIAFHTGTVDGWTNAIERMTITPTGEVGIGATVPARLFHVNGTSRFEGEVEWYEAGQSTSHANYGANRDWYIRSGAAGGKVVIQDASTASYVGIGTSSPGYKLDVNGDINLTGSLRIGGVAQTFGGGGGGGSGTSPWVTVNLTEIHYSGGNVGIGTSDPAHTLHVEGNIYASGNVTAYSDKRKKTNLRIIEDSVKKLEQINGYTYEKDGTEYTGLIAQEVLHILPQAVVGSEEEGYGLAYGNMVGILVEAIKELSNEVKNLKEKLSS